MLKSNNMVLLRGHLGADPEQRPLPSGGVVVELRLATNTRWRTKNGESKERTDWHRVSCFGQLAEYGASWLAKGDHVAVLGQIHNDVVGEGEKRRTYSSVRASEVTGLSRKRDHSGNAPEPGPVWAPRPPAPGQRQEAARPAGSTLMTEDEVPF